MRVEIARVALAHIQIGTRIEILLESNDVTAPSTDSENSFFFRSPYLDWNVSDELSNSQAELTIFDASNDNGR
jgi:hypothetical protein